MSHMLTVTVFLQAEFLAMEIAATYRTGQRAPIAALVA
jgi:hypothetical protein